MHPSRYSIRNDYSYGIPVQFIFECHSHSPSDSDDCSNGRSSFRFV